jgi:membrane protein YqaA with SNARE-associated domain
MSGWSAKIQQYLLVLFGPLGGWGLALIALMDSSFLSLPEVNDLLIVVFTVQNPDSMLFYCAMTTLGSVGGCFLLYSVGRKGGEVLHRKRVAQHQIQRISRWYARHGVLMVIVPSLLPPPTPFKIFVLFAGAFAIPRWKFLLAVGFGRSLRYFSEGFLALLYGRQAKEFIETYYPEIGWTILLLALAILFIRYFWRRFTRPSPRV